MPDFIKPLLSLGFWFNISYLPFMPWLDRALPIVMAAITAIGIGLLLYARFAEGMEKDRRRMLRRFGTMELCAGLAGLMLYFFQWQHAPILSMRIFWVVWLAGFGWWKWKIWQEHFKIIPAQREKAKEREAYEKWLPKPKK